MIQQLLVGVLDAAERDKRVKAVAAVTMYDMTRVMSKGYNDSVTLAERTKSLEQLSRQRWEDAAKGAPAPKKYYLELTAVEAASNAPADVIVKAKAIFAQVEAAMGKMQRNQHFGKIVLRH